MKKIAVFPGQGSQFIGMGKDLYNSFDSVKSLFKLAEETSGMPFKKIIFEGTEEELKSTKNAQISIMLTSVAVLKVLEEKYQKSIVDMVDFVAGHSLGEYSALVANGAISFEDVVKLLKARGEAMEEAVPSGKGAMLAVIGVNDINIINEIAQKATEGDNLCVVANNNSKGQVILSGHKEAIDRAAKIAKDEYGVRIVKHLDVSGPFHSPLMQPARGKLELILNKVDIKSFNIPLISNVTANVVEDESDMKELLLEQLVKPVNWYDSMLKAVNLGVGELIEVGPSKVLSSLTKRIDPNIKALSIECEEDINNFISDNKA